VTGVLLAVAEALAANPAPEKAAGKPVDSPKSGDDSRGFSVEVESGVYIVRGPGVERLVLMTDLGNEDAVRHLDRVLRRRGVFQALRSAGARDGSPVRIGSYEFEFVS